MWIMAASSRRATPPRSSAGVDITPAAAVFGGANQRIFAGVPSGFLMARMVSKSFPLITSNRLMVVALLTVVGGMIAMIARLPSGVNLMAWNVWLVVHSWDASLGPSIRSLASNVHAAPLT